jgi:hypothetical protein
MQYDTMCTLGGDEFNQISSINISNSSPDRSPASLPPTVFIQSPKHQLVHSQQPMSLNPAALQSQRYY